MLKPRILTVGDVTIEWTLQYRHLATPGTKVLGDQFHYLPGGRGTKTAVALARMGADPVLCARIGDDGNGEELLQYLSAEGVDTRFVNQTRGDNTALSVHLREEGIAERCLRFPAAGNRLSASDVEEGFISYPDAVILHGELPAEAYDEAVKMAKKQEIPLFLLSLSDDERYPIARFDSCEILSVDEEQALRYTGIRPSDQEKCMKACMALTQQIKAKYVILRLGERGSFLFDGLYYHFFSSYEVPQPTDVSTSEAFSSALVLEYLRSEGDIRRACEFASIVSALYLTRGGGFRAYPTMEDTKRFIYRNEIDFEIE